MYIKHFRLNGRPYAQGPEPHFLVPNPAVGSVVERLEEVVAGSGAAAVVSGGPGVGKTALVAHVAAKLADDAIVAWADIRQQEPESLIDQLLLGLGMEAGDGSGPLSSHRLRVAVDDQNRAGRSVTAAIDVGTVTAERAKRLLRLAHLLGSTSLGLNVVLMGPHTLHKVLDVPGMIHLRQRVCVRHRVRPLSEEETRNYIGEGLSRVGGDPGGLLGDDAPGMVYRFVAGVPRLINTMMDSALTEAAMREHPRLTADTVRQVAQGLGWRALAGAKPAPAPKATPAPAAAPVPPPAAEPDPLEVATIPVSPEATAEAMASTPADRDQQAPLVTPLELTESAEAETKPAVPEAAKGDALVDMGVAGVPEMDPGDTSATGMLLLEDLDERFAEHVFSEE